jgi:hypothetical protein
MKSFTISLDSELPDDDYDTSHFDRNSRPQTKEYLDHIFTVCPGMIELDLQFCSFPIGMELEAVGVDGISRLKGLTLHYCDGDGLEKWVDSLVMPDLKDLVFISKQDHHAMVTRLCRLPISLQ